MFCIFELFFIDEFLGFVFWCVGLDLVTFKYFLLFFVVGGCCGGVCG